MNILLKAISACVLADFVRYSAVILTFYQYHACFCLGIEQISTTGSLPYIGSPGNSASSPQPRLLKSARETNDKEIYSEIPSTIPNDTEDAVVTFTKTFPTNLNTYNLFLNCTYEGFPICCEALQVNKITEKLHLKQAKHESHSYSKLRNYRGVGNGVNEDYIRNHNSRKQAQQTMKHHHCFINKQYFSSRYEERHIELAKSWHHSIIPNEKARLLELLSVINSPEELQQSAHWIDLVRSHMLYGIGFDDTDEDYLSRFVITKTCFRNPSFEKSKRFDNSELSVYFHSHENTSWVEWVRDNSMFKYFKISPP